MSDWADKKAREWTEETSRCEMKLGSAGFVHDLAALLRQVREEAYQDGRDSTLENHHALQQAYDRGYDAGFEALRRWDEEL